MNQPDRYVQFVLPEGERKVSYKADTKLKDAGTFSFRSEDHTMGNLLRMQLHSDKSMVFAGYRIPHPLEPVMVVKVQTNGTKSPEEALSHALQDLASEFAFMLNEFDREDDASSGQLPQAPAIRLLRSPSASASTPSTADDISVVSSSRIVELHVQAEGDTCLSYGQTLRGTPCPPPAAAAHASAASTSATSAAASTQPFVVRIPASQAYPDWRVLQLRFASARAAPGGLCSLYDIRLLPAASCGSDAASPATADALALSAPPDGSCTAVTSPPPLPGTVPSPGQDTPAARMDPAGAGIGAGDGTAGPSTVSLDVGSGGAAGGAAPASSEESAAGLPAPGPPVRAQPTAVCPSQRQQLRELLQRAAASVPPPAAFSADGPAVTHGSAALPSAAKANLGLAATLARSILSAQTQTGSHPATPPASGPGGQPGGSSAATGQLLPPPAPHQHQHHQQQEQQEQRQQLSTWPAAASGLAASGIGVVSGGGGSGGGFPPLPPPLAGLLAAGPLAAAAAQLADVSARVRRIEEHLLLGAAGGPMGQQRGAAGERSPSSRIAAPSVPPPAAAAPTLGHSDAQPQPPPLKQGQQQDLLDHTLKAPATATAQQQPMALGADAPPPPQPPQAEAVPSQMQLQLMEQLLLSLPALTAGMARLEAAVGQQGAQLAELGRQLAEVQRRVDDVGAVVGAAGGPALPAAPAVLSPPTVEDAGGEAAGVAARPLDPGAAAPRA